MLIGLIDDVNSRFEYPNLALMKIAHYHKRMGDKVEWYCPVFGYRYDKVYVAKVFTYSDEYEYYINADEIVRGGTGYDTKDNVSRLPMYIENEQPDYSMYPFVPNDTAYGFLTRGCVRNCPWCVVPKKEGMIHPYDTIDNICRGGRTKAILMDNNVLACKHGLDQIERIVKDSIEVDFNQGLDARLIDDSIARLLSAVRWKNRFIRIACDTLQNIEVCMSAIHRLQTAGFNGRFFIYSLLDGDIRECLERLNYWRTLDSEKYVPFAQPYRPLTNEPYRVPQWQLDMARWCNKKQIYNSVPFNEYKPRKNFVCAQYFL